MRATLHVFTFKDGLLARMAHDLRLSLARFEVALEDGRVRGSFDPASARVDGVAHGERVDAAGLSDKDKRTIEDTIAKDILDAARHRRVELDGTLLPDPWRVEGRLTIRGRTVDVELPVEIGGDGLVVDVPIVPSRWGVAPYKALAGAIRLQDRWRVRLALEGDEAVLRGAEAHWTPGR